MRAVKGSLGHSPKGRYRESEGLARANGTSRRAIGGWVRKLRAVEDQSAPIPEEITSELGRIIYIVRRAHLRIDRSLSDIAIRGEVKEVRPDARPQARKNRRRIRWNTLRIFSGRERHRWSQIVRRSRRGNVGQAPKLPLKGNKG